jgi:hypothetical protein
MERLAMEISVRPGKVEIGSIRTVIDDGGVKIIEIECVSKYAELVYGYIGRDPLIEFLATDRTLKTTEEEGLTIITFLGVPDYHVIASGGRYTFHVALWRYPVDYWEGERG